MIYVRNSWRIGYDIKIRYWKTSRFPAKSIGNTLRIGLIYIRKETAMKYDCCFFYDIFGKSVYYIFTYMKGVLISVTFIYNFPFSFKVMYFLQKISFSNVLHSSNFNKLFVYTVNVGSFVLIFQFISYCNNVCI